ncbi:hypothetical protein [Microbispora bryophytorum]|uniref:MacB-like periplasmic core domain-containing protein n=1 Tax=Microbispora bryophytorum subsp. camponoti TaxID=1677852 RepID=A0ABR8L6E2_9ACTN|nr:hypothetical protein [Microbispora camponoti]MBD3145005.1 hypothetical protein [Microbispora camponoti]
MATSAPFLLGPAAHKVFSRVAEEAGDHFGVARTAITVLAALLALVLAATVGSGLIQRRGDREERMTDVLGTAFKIYNPGYDIEVRNWGATTTLSMSFTVAARPMRAVGGFVEGYGGVERVVTQDFFGHVGRLPLGHYAGTTLSTALMNVGTGNQPKAVVEFAKPLTTDELVALPPETSRMPRRWFSSGVPRRSPSRGEGRRCGTGP